MSSLFPDISNTVDVNIYNSVTSYGKETDLTLVDGEPQIFEGIEALKLWITKSLKTERYRWLAYSWNYGSEFESIVGAQITDNVKQKEINRLIREALIFDNRIKDISNFKITQDDDVINVTFDVLTALGDNIQIEIGW
jgi:hypothetical protein